MADLAAILAAASPLNNHLKLYAGVMMVRPKALLFFVLWLALCSCAGREPLAPYNPMGLSGKVAPEAETLFSRAHVLWKDSAVCPEPYQAIELLDRAIVIEPRYAAAYLWRGLAKSDTRDWEGAFDDLSVAVRLAPTADAYAYRGLISMRGGNTLGARKDFDRSLEISPGQYRAWNFRAALNLLEGDVDRACRDFREGCANGDCVGLESARREGVCE